MLLMRRILVGLAALAESACATNPAASVDAVTHQRAELVEDFEAALQFIMSTHPDISYSADPAAIDAKAQAVRDLLEDGMTAPEAWSAMALMNPVFADAHVGFRRPIASVKSYQDEGGALFPVPVAFDVDGKLRAAASGPGIEAGDEIIAINGITASRIVAHSAPRMRGETQELGLLILQRYFPIFYWAQNGGFESYYVRVRRKRGDVATVRLAGEASYRRPAKDFVYEQIDERVGLIEVRTFDKERLAEFRDFLANAFARISSGGVESLIIDIRANGGGANDVADLLIGYLTDKPYSPISSVKARITLGNIQLAPIPGVEPGMVLDLPFTQTRTPPANLDNRFDGKVYVLTGRMSYSAAIVFATIIQDLGLGQLAGEPPIGPANQTGQVQTFTMPNTGLEALAPLYVFRRPNGDASRSRIEVDIPLEDDPLDPSVSVAKLLQVVRQTANRPPPEATANGPVSPTLDVLRNSSERRR